MVVTLGVVAACAPVPKHAKYSVGYYRTHTTLRDAVLARCANDPGDKSRVPDCINARSAARLAGIGSLRHLPPMGLPGKPGAGRRP